MYHSDSRTNIYIKRRGSCAHEHSSLGLWHRVDWYIGTNVSEELPASIFRIVQEE